jgi:hypothetical protein
VDILIRDEVGEELSVIPFDRYLYGQVSDDIPNNKFIFQLQFRGGSEIFDAINPGYTFEDVQVPEERIKVVSVTYAPSSGITTLVGEKTFMEILNN